MINKSFFKKNKKYNKYLYSSLLVVSFAVIGAFVGEQYISTNAENSVTTQCKQSYGCVNPTNNSVTIDWTNVRGVNLRGGHVTKFFSCVRNCSDGGAGWRSPYSTYTPINTYDTYDRVIFNPAHYKVTATNLRPGINYHFGVSQRGAYYTIQVRTTGSPLNPSTKPPVIPGTSRTTRSPRTTPTSPSSSECYGWNATTSTETKQCSNDATKNYGVRTYECVTGTIVARKCNTDIGLRGIRKNENNIYVAVVCGNTNPSSKYASRARGNIDQTGHSVGDTIKHYSNNNCSAGGTQEATSSSECYGWNATTSTETKQCSNDATKNYGVRTYECVTGTIVARIM